VVLSLAGSAPQSSLASMEHKLAYIEANGRSAHPNPAPTTLSEPEVNAYLASRDMVLPQGVKSVKLRGDPDVITGTALVDFDLLREGARWSNPLLTMFSGVHEVVVIAHAQGENHQGQVHVDSVSLDGVVVPRFVLRLFVEKYLQPKYPELGLDSHFALPDRIETARVELHKVVVVQR
jgi:hypothetical protein